MHLFFFRVHWLKQSFFMQNSCNMVHLNANARRFMYASVKKFQMFFIALHKISILKVAFFTGHMTIK